MLAEDNKQYRLFDDKGALINEEMSEIIDAFVASEKESSGVVDLIDAFIDAELNIKKHRVKGRRPSRPIKGITKKQCETLRECMKKENLYQMDLCKLLGISPSTFSRRLNRDKGHHFTPEEFSILMQVIKRAKLARTFGKGDRSNGRD